MHFPLNMNKSQTRHFLDFFLAIKSFGSPFKSLQPEMTDFATLSYTSTSEIPTLSYT